MDLWISPIGTGYRPAEKPFVSLTDLWLSWIEGFSLQVEQSRQCNRCTEKVVMVSRLLIRVNARGGKTR